MYLTGAPQDMEGEREEVDQHGIVGPPQRGDLIRDALAFNSRTDGGKKGLGQVELQGLHEVEQIDVATSKELRRSEFKAGQLE